MRGEIGWNGGAMEKVFGEAGGGPWCMEDSAPAKTCEDRDCWLAWKVPGNGAAIRKGQADAVAGARDLPRCGAGRRRECLPELIGEDLIRGRFWGALSRLQGNGGGAKFPADGIEGRAQPTGAAQGRAGGWSWWAQQVYPGSGRPLPREVGGVWVGGEGGAGGENGGGKPAPRGNHATARLRQDLVGSGGDVEVSVGVAAGIPLGRAPVRDGHEGASGRSGAVPVERRPGCGRDEIQRQGGHLPAGGSGGCKPCRHLRGGGGVRKAHERDLAPGHAKLAGCGGKRFPAAPRQGPAAARKGIDQAGSGVSCAPRIGGICQGQAPGPACLQRMGKAQAGHTCADHKKAGSA